MSKTVNGINIQDVVFRWTSLEWRLVSAILVGCVVFVLSYRLEPEMRLLLAYDVTISVYLTLLLLRMKYADQEATRCLATKREVSSAVVLIAAVALFACGLVGVGFMLQHSTTWTPLLMRVHLGLSLIAVFVSWALEHVMFALHYARLYYDPTPRPGEPTDHTPLEFPDNQQPDYWDFMYFAFTLAVCYQVSDVTIYSRHLRRVALAHMLLSFLNVTMILGLVVEIVSTII